MFVLCSYGCACCWFGSTKYILETRHAFINIPGGGLRCRLKRGLITLITVLRTTYCEFKIRDPRPKKGLHHNTKGLRLNSFNPNWGWISLGANRLCYGVDLFLVLSMGFKWFTVSLTYGLPKGFCQRPLKGTKKVLSWIGKIKPGQSLIWGL